MKQHKDALTTEQFYDIYAPVFAFEYSLKELLKKAEDDGFAVFHNGYVYIVNQGA